MEKHESRRAKMTKRLLHEALMELMQEKPFKQITIKELCERADLNRTTFYLHYADQQSVLDDIEREVKEQTLAYIQNVNPSAKAVDLIEAFLHYIQKNEVLFRTLLCNNNGDDFQVELIQYILEGIRTNLPNYGDPTTERYVHTFLMHGSVHIIIDWIEAGFDLPAREVAKLCFRLCDSVRTM
ncbi:MAG: TetR/AcrR family transcriptional regulator C-terminal domain-containing protein [Lachnospiraceae bacterium]|nr:TetR/AcrR family transcriptional regulator C-terminal domain-containing protein [Lachnospiraceae bacterium]